MANESFCDIELKYVVKGFLLLLIVMMLGIFSLVFAYYGYFTVVLPVLIIVLVIALLAPSGFFINNPNEARVIEFFGNYVGTISNPGFFCTIPFSCKRVVSLKVNNISTEKIKVNDLTGNPIEIAAVIVWKVISPAKACFNVSNYQHFAAVQSDSAIRELAGSYSYDSDDDSDSLRKNSDIISDKLKIVLQKRLNIAGLKVEDARISHLAYSAEIAHVMLRRQQAKAIISAQEYIMKSAISMIDDVIAHFERNKKMTLTDEQKVKLINNILVSLISEQGTQPTITLE